MTESDRVPPQASSLSLRTLAREIRQDFGRSWEGLVAFELLFHAFKAWLWLPAIALVLSIIMAQTGNVAVGNTEILGFLLSPLGLCYAAAFACAAAALILLEEAGILAMVAVKEANHQVTVSRALVVSLRHVVRVAKLGSIKVVLLAMTLLPLLGIAALVYALLLTQHDIYFYWTMRPPRFWFAAGIGALIATVGGICLVVLYVWWSLALPILLFERQPASAALRLSRQRTRGQVKRIACLQLGWIGFCFVLGVLLVLLYQWLAAAMVDWTGLSSMGAILFLLVLQGLLIAGLSFLATVGQVLLARRIYLARNRDLGIEAGTLLPAEKGTLGEGPVVVSPWIRPLVWAAIGIVLLSPVVVGWNAWHQVASTRTLAQVTAHRGHDRLAPENTLSALRKGIESGADYVEIDVHLTSDGVLMLLHDRDLKRVTGDSRRLDQLTRAEVQQLDAGSWFSPEFKGERVPTLEEAIDVCRGHIRMNIEVKTFGPVGPVVTETVRVIHDQDFADQCIITSLSYRALQEVKRQDPTLLTGFIVAQSVGDIGRLDVNALSVRAEHLTDAMMLAAHQRGLDMLAWTVNDPQQMLELYYRGVDNLIVSDPELAVGVRDYWNNMSDAERLVVSTRILLGLSPRFDVSPSE